MVNAPYIRINECNKIMKNRNSSYYTWKFFIYMIQWIFFIHRNSCILVFPLQYTNPPYSLNINFESGIVSIHNSFIHNSLLKTERILITQASSCCLFASNIHIRYYMICPCEMMHFSSRACFVGN